MDKYFKVRQGKAVFIKDYFKAIPGSDSTPVFPCSANVVEIPYKHNVIEIPFSPHVANLNYDCESSVAVDIFINDDWLTSLTFAGVADLDSSMVTPFNVDSVVERITGLLLHGDKKVEENFMKAGERDTLYIIEQGRGLTVLKKLVDKYLHKTTWEEFRHIKFNDIISARNDNRYRRVGGLKKVEEWVHLGIVKLDWLAGVVRDAPYCNSENPISDFIRKHGVFKCVVYCHNVDQEKEDLRNFNRAVFFEKIEKKGIDLSLLDGGLLEDICYLSGTDHLRKADYVNKLSKDIKKVIKSGGNPNDYLYELCSNVGAPSSDASPKFKAPVSFRCEFVLFDEALEKAFVDDRYGKDVLLEKIDYMIGRLLKYKEKRFSCEL
ncbi:hypothetical protein KAI46_02805 [bacterium]|nr:hypothetical protein [bacterium]